MPPRDLPPVRVEAKRAPSEDVDDAPTVSSTVITREAFEGRAVTIADVLRDAVGLTVRGSQGTGNIGTVAIRGSTPEQVEVFLDGVPLSRAIGGATNLADVPLENVDRIEIYRGTAPARLGGAAMGGAINVVTRRATGLRRFEASALGGSLGLFGFDTTMFFQGFGYSRLSVEMASGDFQRKSDNGTPYNAADDYLTTRVNNGYSIANWLTRLDLPLREGIRLAFSNHFLLRDNGIPGDGPPPGAANESPYSARFSTFRYVFAADFEKQGLFVRRLDLATQVFVTYANENYRDPNGASGAGVSDATGIFASGGFRADLTYLWGDHQRLVFHTDYRGESASLSDPPHQTSSTGDRNALRVALSDEVRLAKGRIVVDASAQLHLTYDTATLAGPLQPAPAEPAWREDISARFGVAWRPRDFVTLRANAARTFRAPNLTELFGNQGTLMGNATLRPESGFSADAAIRFDVPLGEGERDVAWFEAAYFRAVATDLIQFVATSSVTAKPFNIGRADIRGVEAQAGGALGPLSLSAGYTWTRAVDESGGGTHGLLVPSRPGHQFRAKAALSKHGARVFYEYLYVSDNYIDTLNRFTLEPRSIHNVGAVIEVKRFARISVEMKNVTNNRTSDVFGMPLPGIAFATRLTATF